MNYEEMIAMQKKYRNKPHELEHRMQVACVKWFRYTFPHLRYALFAVPNGGRRDATTGAKLKAEGVVAGVSDLILLRPSGKWHALCIEMKAPHGRQSDEQKNFQNYCEHAGYKYVVCRSSEEFAKCIDEYLYLGKND